MEKCDEKGQRNVVEIRFQVDSCVLKELQSSEPGWTEAQTWAAPKVPNRKEELSEGQASLQHSDDGRDAGQNSPLREFVHPEAPSGLSEAEKQDSLI